MGVKNGDAVPPKQGSEESGHCVFIRRLQRYGICVRSLYYTSLELADLIRAIGTNVHVEVLIDGEDLTSVRITDPRRAKGGPRFIRAYVHESTTRGRAACQFRPDLTHQMR